MASIAEQSPEALSMLDADSPTIASAWNIGESLQRVCIEPNSVLKGETYPIRRRRKGRSNGAPDALEDVDEETEHHDRTTPVSVNDDVETSEVPDDCGVNVQPALGNRENDTSMMLPDGNASPNGRVALQSHAIGWEAMTTNDGVEYNAQDVNVSYDTELLGNFANSDFFSDQSVGVSGINWLSPEYYTSFDWAQPTAVDGTSIPSYDRLHILSSAGNQIVQGPWFDLVAEPLPRIQEPPATSSHDMHDPGQTLGTRYGGSSNGSVMSTSTTGTYYVDGAPTRAPFKGGPVQIYGEEEIECPGLPNVVQADDYSEGSNGPTPLLLSTKAHESLIHKLKDEGCFKGLALNPTQLPSLSHTKVYFRLYFHRFHPAYPFLRKSTSIYDSESNWLVLLAICAIGSKYAPGVNNDSQKETLFLLLEKAIFHHISEHNGSRLPACWGSFCEARPDDSWTLGVVQATILYLVCKPQDPKNDSYRLEVAARQFLLECCRELGLLNIATTKSTNIEFAPKEDVLKAWIQKQSRIRTGMMVWILDSILALEFKQEPLLRLGDVKGVLPCPEPLWEKPGLEEISRDNSKTVRIHDALSMLYTGKKLPPSIGDFGTIVLTYAVCQRTKDAIYQHQSKLYSWTPTADVAKHSEEELVEESWPPSLPILSRWRNSACDCLDLLHWNANAIIAKAGGWEHPALLHLHLSRLILLTPINHMRTLAVAASLGSFGRSVDKSKVEIARTSIAKWAINDQYKASLSIIHAGALLWHIRRYSIKNVLEPFAIFASTLVIWSYSTMMLFMNPHNAALTRMPGTSRGEHSRDGFMGSQASPNDTGAAGDESEEPEPKFLHLDRPCDDEMVQTYVKLGHRMSGHVAKVGDICQEGAPKKILREGIRMLTGLEC
ncbi:transcription factor ZMS1 [Colletotrichum asianum]